MNDTRMLVDHAARVLVVVIAVLAMLAVATPPADAVHQNCGASYPTGTLGNGHPDLGASQDVGWAGQAALNRIETSIFITTSVKDSLMNGAGVAGAVGDVMADARIHILRTLPSGIDLIAETPIRTAELVVRGIAIALTIAALVALIVETVFLAEQRALAGKVGGENACGGVLSGDMLDQIWVSLVQRNLASNGPPLAMLLIPTDSKEAGGGSGEWPLQPQHESEDFTWCPTISLPDELPTPAATTDLSQANGSATGGDCVPSFHDGFLTSPWDGAPRVTVQAIVRDAIDHAKAHGLDVRAAESDYGQAVTLASQDRPKEAFAHFRAAYQAAAGFDG